MAKNKIREKKEKNKNLSKIVLSWDGNSGEDATFTIAFKPDPLDPETNLRSLMVLLANGFATGILQLMSVVKPLPQPTEEELKAGTYDFELHGKEFGEGLFALYNYKKTLMEEFVQIVERTLPDAFHDVLFVKGAQEKIFEQLREEHRAKKELEDSEVSEIKENKGEVS